MNRLFSLLLMVSLLLFCCACSDSTEEDSLSTGEPLTTIVTPDTDTEDTPSVPDTTDTPEDTIPNNEADSEPDKELENEPDNTISPEEERGRTVDPYGKMVALTFDDGPHGTYSDIILDILEENNSVATFFEVGQNVRTYPDVLRRMASLGCEIASHSNVHYNLTKLSYNALLTDLGYADDAISAATGNAPTLLRPPYGSVNDTVKYETGRAIITWTVDTEDWRLKDAQKLIAYFENYGDLDGEVVLLHSIHGSTAEAMETVIPWLIEQGYQLVTVSELMAYYYGVLLEPNTFYNQTWFARHERTEYPLELPTEPMQTQIPDYDIVPVVPNATKPNSSSSGSTTQTPDNTPPTDSSTDTPPADDTLDDTPPVDSSTDTPPADDTTDDTPPADTSTDTPPADDTTDNTPPTDDSTDIPPVDDTTDDTLPTP